MGRPNFDEYYWLMIFHLQRTILSAKYIVEVSENSFEFNLLSVEDVHHIGIPKLECKDDWVSFQFSGAQIQLHSSKPLNRFSTHCSMPSGQSYWTGDEFGTVKNARVSPGLPATTRLNFVLLNIHFCIDGSMNIISMTPASHKT
jgi:hypothetical protein